MTEQVDQLVIEPVADGSPGADLNQALLEPAARPKPPGLLSQQLTEPATRPDPPEQVDALGIESTDRPVPPVSLLTQLIEVVWREPPPRGIFAFRHDWSQPWIERWAWRTQILRSRDGTESRIRLRQHPRRSVETLVTAAEAEAIGLDAWLSRHQGRESLFPLWPVAQRVTSDTPAGAQYLELDAVTEPLMRATQTEALDAWGQGPALLIKPDGDVQQVEITAFDDGDLEATTVMPLARPVAAGSLFIPLVPGQLADNLTSTRHSGAISRQSIEFSAAERVFEYFWEPYLFLEQIPVLIDHEQWQPEPTIEYAARIERIDNQVGKPWVRRVDDRPSRILSRRWLVQGQWAIDQLLGLFEYLAGRLNPVWLPDEHTGIRLAQPAFTGDDRLTIQRKRLPWHWEEPGLGLLIRGYDDEPSAVRIAALEAESDTEARLLLADPLEVNVSIGMPITLLHFARLDQDQVEIHWHTRDIVEVAARFTTLARCHLYGEALEY